MSEVPVQLIVAAFDDENGAEDALKALKAAKKEKLIGIQGAVVMYKDASGKKIHYKEVGLTPGKGALGGAVLGAALGVITGGATIALGAAGTLIGGLVGRKKQSSRFSSDRINQVAAALKPGSSAIVAVIEHKWVTELEKALEELGADLLTAAISADIAQQIEAHRDVAYSALVSDLGLATSRVAAGEDEVQVSGTVITKEGAVHGEIVAGSAGTEDTQTTENE